MVLGAQGGKRMKKEKKDMNTTNNEMQAKTFDAKAILEIQELAFKSVQDYCKAKGIERGLVKEQHAGMMVHALVEHGLIAEDVESRKTAFFILCRLENGSQLRQELEKAGTLSGKDALADKYAGLL